MHRVPYADGIGSVASRGLLILWLKVDDVSLIERIVLRSIIVLSQLLCGDSHVSCDTLIGIILVSEHIEEAIADIGGAHRSVIATLCLCRTTSRRRTTRVPSRILASVEGIEFVILDDLDQHICIALIRSISAELQALSPTAIIVVAKSEEALIAACLEELGVVIIALLR